MKNRLSTVTILVLILYVLLIVGVVVLASIGAIDTIGS